MQWMQQMQFGFWCILIFHKVHMGFTKGMQWMQWMHHFIRFGWRATFFFRAGAMQVFRQVPGLVFCDMYEMA